jgi:para-nitrobenzyl esterase
MKTVNRTIVALLSWIVFIAFVSTSLAAANPSIVRTEQGPVGGTVTDGLREFLGIPYAAPPLRSLRWRPPQEHASWFTPLNTTRFAPHCPQQASVFGTESVSEDCLFLNIFTPSDAPNERDKSHGYPVMVWIHGGALTVGESDDYIPTKLVHRGRVIVVTINYRLGALGFLAHPALSTESPHHISGNYGILDQQFALKWVKRNISAFGGDPQTVTLFGESGGGLSIFSQLNITT